MHTAVCYIRICILNKFLIHTVVEYTRVSTVSFVVVEMDCPRTYVRIRNHVFIVIT